MNYSANNKGIPSKFKIDLYSDNKSDSLSISLLAGQYSSFVFLVSMKYLKNEEKSKDAAIQIFIKLKNTLNKKSILDIKSWLYNETKNYCMKKKGY